MSKTALKIKRHEFVATCRALSAAAKGSSMRKVTLRFEPLHLIIESDYGGGIVETNGASSTEVRVTHGLLAKIASLHRKEEDSGSFIKVVLDDELGEIQFPHGGLKAKFVQ